MKPKLEKTSHLIRLGSVSKETKGIWGKEADWLGAECFACWEAADPA
ncbi:MAG: hypothetical protein GY877_13650 [Hyphomicrobium sp.]|nr:hypothetical protein [Hyphomicrobium sp.]